MARQVEGIVAEAINKPPRRNKMESAVVFLPAVSIPLCSYKSAKYVKKPPTALPPVSLSEGACNSIAENNAQIPDTEPHKPQPVSFFLHGHTFLHMRY